MKSSDVNKIKWIKLEELLNENTRIETISDIPTLKKVFTKVVECSSYTRCKRDQAIKALEEIYDEFE